MLPVGEQNIELTFNIQIDELYLKCNCAYSRKLITPIQQRVERTGRVKREQNA